MPRPLLSIVLLACIVLAVFHRLLWAEISVVDDVGMFKGMLASGSFDLAGFFFPGGGTATYYRPMIGLSFGIEKLLWSMHPAMLHLDNILFHLANSLLLYFVARRLMPDERRDGYAPLAAALLFALHPLVTESVDWISGRTDLLATTFVLLSALALLRWRETGSWRHLFLALAAQIPAILAKETALAFPLAAAWILSTRREAGETVGDSWIAGPTVRRAACCIAVALALAALVYLLRRLAFSAEDFRIGIGAQLMLAKPGETLASMVSAFGFYLKKFLLPLPLNFAITAISPWYLAVGAGAVVISAFCALRRDTPSVLFLAGCCMLLPALLVINGTVTWTPYAERYCYPPLPFWSLAAVMWGERLAARLRLPVRATSAAFILIIAVMAVITWRRNALWLTNEALLADTVNKSPFYVKVREHYMVALAMKDDTRGADRQTAIIRAMLSPGFNEEQDLALAEDMLRRGAQRRVFPFVEAKMRAEFGDTPRLSESMRSFYRRLYERTGDRDVLTRIAPVGVQR